MSNPSSCRNVTLIDLRVPGKPLIKAKLYRDYPLIQLDEIEAQWSQAREKAATADLIKGLTPLEHAHWDWRNKADSVEAGNHMLVAVECEGEPQGVMAVLRTPRPAQLGEGQVVYVDYLESAPWNLKGFSESPRFAGVGTCLIADAVRLSLETGLGGRVGLHSLEQAETFYARCAMTRVGMDPYYFDLTYFEYTGRRATDWLASIGESL
jgi:hypothetical protein